MSDLPDQPLSDHPFARQEQEPDDEGFEGDCTHCCGEGLVECYDPLQCTSAPAGHDLCPCSACGGSGLAKDQTIW